MELVRVDKLSHKEWRRKAKKERRRRLRTRDARARDSDAQRLDSVLQKDPAYLNWIETQRVNEELKAIQEAEEHDIQEQKWLEEEVRAQKEWRIQQDRKAKARQEQLDQEARIRKDFEAKQEELRLRKEEVRRREEEESNRLAEVQREIDEYINEGTRTPEVLRAVKNTQPGKEPCPFFSKTGACRYGDTCSRNHQRLALSKFLLIPGFYSHFSLEKNSAEYDTDVILEFNSSEMRQHFREFYNDVVPELESFGRIKTLKLCCNVEIHLRGNMYVEYYTEREAARALISLKGRWYAGRQLNCEFTNLKSWRNAVCGMPKCPKGRACNFLHTIRNPRDEYDIKSPPRSRMRAGTSQDDRRFQQGTTSSSRSSRIDQESSRSGGWQHQTSREESTRNWRWSDSPESAPESPSRSGRSSDRRGSRDEERNSRRTRKRYRDSRRSRHGESGDEALEDDAGIQDTQSPRRRREETVISRSKAKKKKKKKKRRDDEVVGDQEEQTKNRGSVSHRNGKHRSAVIDANRGIEKRKERSRKRDSSRKTSEKIEKTKWDDPNCTTDSESDSNPARSKKQRPLRRSRSRSWSEVDTNEVTATSAPGSEEKKNRSPHR